MSYLKSILKKNTGLRNIAVRIYGLVSGFKGWYYRLRNFPGVFVDSSTRVIGWANIEFKGSASIGANSFVNVNHRRPGIKSLTIGHGVYLGRGNFISVGLETIFCDYVITASNCAFIGSHHIYSNPMVPYISTGTVNMARIRIGPNTFIGYGVTILGSVSIGFGSVIGSNCIVDFDIPPLSLVLGTPAKIIKRYDIELGQWLPTENVEVRITEEDYLRVVNKHRRDLILPFFAASSGFGDI